jgi:hypothetical protein
MISVISKEQAGAFGILRRPQIETDLLPEDRWGCYRMGRIGQLEFNLALARRARTPLGNVWIIPGDGWICLSLASSRDSSSLDSGGMTANRTESAIAGRMITWTGSRSGPGQMVWGLAPDTITAVELLTADGSTTTAEVSDNTYGADLGAALATVCIAGETILELGAPDR